MKLSRYEQETIVNYNAGEQTAILYTWDKEVMRKLDTLVADFSATYKLTGQDEISNLFLSEVIRQLPKTEGGWYRAEGTGKADDDWTEQSDRTERLSRELDRICEYLKIILNSS